VEDLLPEWQYLIWKALRALRPDVLALVAGWDGRAAHDHRSPDRRLAVLLAQRQFALGLPPYDARPGQFPPSPLEGLRPDLPASPPSPLRLTDEDVINAAWVVAAGDDPAVNPGGQPRVPVDRLALKSNHLRAIVGPERVGVGAPPPPSERPEQGGVLTGDALAWRLDGARPVHDRLIVTPMMRDALGNAALDVRLGQRFITFQRSGLTSLTRTSDPRSVQRLVEKGREEAFVLHPGELVLAATLEYIALPRDLAAQVITRSSYGRLGLLTATAVQVHPLYRGCLTLELVNLGSVPISLRPGERIAQLVFTTALPPRPTPAVGDRAMFAGKYKCPIDPEFSMVRDDDDAAILPGLLGAGGTALK